MTVRDSQGRVTKKFRINGFSVMKDQNLQSAVGKGRKGAKCSRDTNLPKIKYVPVCCCPKMRTLQCKPVPASKFSCRANLSIRFRTQGMYHHLLIVYAKIGKWTGKVHLKTGATRSIISQEIINKLGVIKENIKV